MGMDIPLVIWVEIEDIHPGALSLDIVSSIKKRGG
jgi:hypothetical protein